MKKTFCSTILVSLFALGAAGISHAQDFLAPIEAKIDTLKQQKDAAQAQYLAEKEQAENAASSSVEVTKPLDEERSRIAQEFENALASLNDLVARIQSRIAKMQAAGADISSADALLNITKADIASSTDDVPTWKIFSRNRHRQAPEAI